MSAREADKDMLTFDYYAAPVLAIVTDELRLFEACSFRNSLQPELLSRLTDSLVPLLS